MSLVLNNAKINRKVFSPELRGSAGTTTGQTISSVGTPTTFALSTTFSDQDSYFDTANNRLYPRTNTILGIEFTFSALSGTANADQSVVYRIIKNNATIIAQYETYSLTSTNIIMRLPQVSFNSTDFITIEIERQNSNNPTVFTGSLNYYQETHEFTAPIGITEYILFGCGAGGAGLGKAAVNYNNECIQAGAGSYKLPYPITLVPNTTYSVLTPLGACGGNDQYNDQATGFNASFGSLVSFVTGRSNPSTGEFRESAAQNGMVVGAAASLVSDQSFWYGSDGKGFNSVYARSGQMTTSSGSFNGYGFSGSGGMFTGGTGSINDYGTPSDGLNGGSSTGIGGGGGSGCRGTNSSNNPVNTYGGSGGNSEIEIIWVE